MNIHNLYIENSKMQERTQFSRNMQKYKNINYQE